MKKKSVKMTACIAAMAAVFSLTACGNGNAESGMPAAAQETETDSTETLEDGQKLSIAFVAYSDSEPTTVLFRSGMEQCVEDYKAKGIDIEVSGFNPEGDSSKQVSGIENMVSKNVQAIVFSPIDSDALAPAVKQAKADGVVVVSFDQRVNTEVDAEITIDNPTVGKMMGEEAVRILQGTGKVLVVETPPAVTSCKQRSDAAIEVLEAAGMEVVTVLTDTPTREKEMTAIENALQADPDIQAIIGIDTDTSMAGVLACEAQNMTDVAVICPDITDEVKEAIKGGRCMKSVIDTKHSALGYAATEAAVKLLLGEEAESVVLSDFDIVTEENIDG